MEPWTGKREEVVEAKDGWEGVEEEGRRMNGGRLVLLTGGFFGKEYF